MPHIAQWLRELKEEAPWYFWLLGVCCVLAAGLESALSGLKLTVVITFFTLFIAAEMLRRYKFFKCGALYVASFVSLLSANMISLFGDKYIDGLRFIYGDEFDFFELKWYMLYCVTSFLVVFIFIILLTKFKKQSLYAFKKYILCAIFLNIAYSFFVYAVFSYALLMFAFC